MSVSSNDSLISFHSSLELQAFIDIMDSLSLSGGDAILEWTLTTNKEFTVKSYYGFLNDDGLRSKFRKSIWKSTIPLKIKIFAWLVTHDKILSRSNLIRRGWAGSPHCELCDHNLETTEHIFFHYLMSTNIWNFFLNNIVCLNDVRISKNFSLFRLVKYNINVKGWTTLVLAIL